MRKQIIFAIFSLATLSIHADEGMWMLTDLKAQNAVAMRELGLEIPVEEVYNANGISLKDAVVHFGGGCTGEVISSEGLVLTNLLIDSGIGGQFCRGDRPVGFHKGADL